MRFENHGRSRKRDTSPNYNYNRSLTSTDTDFLEHDYFEFMKPTDYTYSRSPSYRRKVRSEHYQMPNMKRRQLKGVYQTEEYSTDEEVEEEEEAGYITDEEIVKTRTVIEDGMLLRSGHSLKNKKTMMERMKARRSLMSRKEYETLTSESHSSGKAYHSGTYSGETSQILDKNHINSTSWSKSHRSLMSSDGFNRSMDNYNMSDQRSNKKANSKDVRNHSAKVTTVTKTLVEKFEEEEDEKGMRETPSTKKRKKKDAVIKHMYGLDSEELSETEWSLMNPATRGSSSNSIKGQSSSESDTSITTTIVTTVVESISYVTSPIVKPVWNTIGQPIFSVLWTIISTIVTVLHYVLWTSSGKHIYSLGKSFKNSSWNIVQYFIMHFILIDTWILKRRKGAGCCLCLPLLLLLPLLFLGSTSILSVLSESSIFTASSNRIIKVDNSAGIKIGHLEGEVKRIIIQLQENRHVLTSIDVESIVQRMLQQELKQLKLGLDETQNQHKATIMGQGNDFNQRLTLLTTQIVDNITILQDRLSAEITGVMSDGKSQSSAATLNIQKLQQEISDLRTALGNIELSQDMIQLQMKNCCKNDSFYAMTIQTHVNKILQQLMAGQKTGIDDQDAFTAWFHTNYVSRQDLNDHLAKFGQEITKMVMLEVEKQQKTQVVLGEGGLSEQLVNRIVEEALLKYSADKLALPDFALESAGGSVVSTRCSQTYHRKTAQYSILGIPLWYVSNSPRTVIQPELHPGSCWAFQGAQGYLVVELSAIIQPTAFTLEHIPKSLTPDGKITSAPKDFMVLGLSKESDTQGTNLGNYTYHQDGKPLQFFPIQRPGGIYKFIELQILSNHGNQMFTCLYRFRVHGIPAKQDSP